MPETAIERLRRLAGLAPANDATTVARKPQPAAPAPRYVRPLPEKETEEEVLRRRGRELAGEDRRFAVGSTTAEAPQIDRPRLTPPGKQHLKAASDATEVRRITPPGQPTIGERIAKQPGNIDPDYLRGLARQKQNAANYNGNEQMRSVAERLEEDARIEQERGGSARAAGAEAVQAATMGIAAHAPGSLGRALDPRIHADKQKALRLQNKQAVTGQELRDSGIIGQDDLQPRLPGEGDGYGASRTIAEMAGNMAGIVTGPLAVERALVKRGIRSAALAGRSTGFSRIGGVEKGIRGMQAYEAPSSIGARMAKEATEFAVPGVITDVNRATAEDRDPVEAAELGAVTNMLFGGSIPLAGAAGRGVARAASRFAPEARETLEVAKSGAKALAGEGVPARKPKYDYSSTQLDLPEPTAKKIIMLSHGIDDADLAEKGRVGKIGADDGPHVTVKYGLHGNEPEKVRELLADEKPITVELGKTSVFPNGESNAGDVVKIDVESAELRRLNKKIADALPHTDTHPTYNPHVTLAYVKPGKGEKYAGDAAMRGHRVTIDKLTFSGQDGSLIEIPLGKKKTKLDELREMAQPAIDKAGQIDRDPRVKKAALIGAGAYTLGHLEDTENDEKILPAVALVGGFLTDGQVLGKDYESAAKMLKAGQISKKEYEVLVSDWDIQKLAYDKWKAVHPNGQTIETGSISTIVNQVHKAIKGKPTVMETKPANPWKIKQAGSNFIAINPEGVVKHVSNSEGVIKSFIESQGGSTMLPIAAVSKAAKAAGIDPDEAPLGHVWETTEGFKVQKDGNNKFAIYTPSHTYLQSFPNMDAVVHYMDSPNFGELEGLPETPLHKEIKEAAANKKKMELLATPHSSAAKHNQWTPLDPDAEGAVVPGGWEIHKQPNEGHFNTWHAAPLGFKNDPSMWSNGYLNPHGAAEHAWQIVNRDLQKKEGGKWHIGPTAYGDLKVYGPEGGDAGAHGIFSNTEEALEHIQKKLDLVERDLPPEGSPFRLDLSTHLKRIRHAGDERRAANLEKFMHESSIQKPLLHYTNRNFDTFDRGEFGFHLTGVPTAGEKRVQSDWTSLGWEPNAQALPVWVNIKKPYRLPDLGEFGPSNVLTQLRRDGLIDHEVENELALRVEAIRRDSWNLGRSERMYREMEPIREFLKDGGYDGIVYRNKYEKGGDSYIAFDPTQIKSMIGNTGDFDPKIPAIVAGGAISLKALQEADDDKKDKIAGAAAAGAFFITKGKGARRFAKEFSANDVIIGREGTNRHLSKPLHETLDEMARKGTRESGLQMEPRERELVLRLANIGKATYREAFNKGDDALVAAEKAKTAIKEATEKIENTNDRMRLMASGAANEINHVPDFEPLDASLGDVIQARNEVRSRLKGSDRKRALRALDEIEAAMDGGGEDFQAASKRLNLWDRYLVTTVMPGASMRSASGEAIDGFTKVKHEDFNALDEEFRDRIFKGQSLYMNPLDPADILKLYKAHPTVFAGGAIIGAGAGLADLGEKYDNEKLEWTGRGMMGLGAIHMIGAHKTASGRPLYQAAAAKGGNLIVDALKDTKVGRLKGRHVLDFFSHDILASPELRRAADEFEKDRAKAAAVSLEFKAKLKRLGDVSNRGVTDEITGETWEPAVRNLSPAEAKAMIDAAEELRNEFTHLGWQEVRRGTLALGQFTKFDRQYVPYLYPETEALRAGKVGGGPTPTQTPRVRGHKARTDIPMAERQKMGQIRESDYLAEQGLRKGYNNIASAKLFSALTMIPGSLHPEYEKAVRALMAANQGSNKAAIKRAKRHLQKIQQEALGDLDRGQFAGYRTLPTSKGLGVLSGAIVKNDIASYLEGLPAFGTRTLADNLFMQWKKIHTVWNPGTHVGNFVSNIVTAHMKGLPINEQIPALVRANREIKNYGKYARALTEAGVMDQNIATMDYGAGMLHEPRSAIENLRQLAGRTLPQTKRKLEEMEITPHSQNKALKAGRKVDEKLATAYNLEDNWFRVALLQKVTKSPKQGGLGLNMKQGVEYVRHHMGDFRTRSTALRMAKWYSPFVMYPAKMVPHMLGSVVEHPFRWMTLAGLWGAVDQIGAYASGEGDYKGIEKRIKSGRIDDMDLPEDQRPSRGFGYLIPGPIQAPIKRRNMKFATDISRYTPFSSLSGQAAPGSLAAALSSRIPAIAAPGGPLADLFARNINADPYTGERFIKPNDTGWEKTKKLAGTFIGNQIFPSAVSWHAPRVWDDIQNRDSEKAVIDAMGFAGARPRTVIPGQRAKQDKYWYEDSKEEAKRDLNKKLRLAAKSPKRQRAASQEFNEQMQRLGKEYVRRNTRPK